MSMSENPYQTPKYDPLLGDVVLVGRFGPLRDISLLAKFSKVMLWVNVLFSVIFISFTVWSVSWMTGSSSNIVSNMTTYFELIMLLSTCNSVIIVVSIITICMWTTKAMANTWSFAKPTITPGWAAGWYFIPIANLWKPYKAVSEMWEAVNKEHKSKKILLVWWITWLICMLLNIINVYMQTGLDNNVSLSLQLSGIYDILSLLTSLLSIISAICLIKIIGLISDAHNSKLHTY